MPAHEKGLIDAPVCPFFGAGCDTVGWSEHTRHVGVPNAALGALGYAATAVLAIRAGASSPTRRPWHPLALSAVPPAAAVTSAVLTWEQAVRVHARCFWCPTPAAIDAAIPPLSLVDAAPVWRWPRRPPARGAGGLSRSAGWMVVRLRQCDPRLPGQ
ncbi:MAG TPA: vitamin K epoxide reductase family protein [Chloroflexota bacterium]|jgi:hypothetical protein